MSHFFLGKKGLSLGAMMAKVFGVVIMTMMSLGQSACFVAPSTSVFRQHCPAPFAQSRLPAKADLGNLPLLLSLIPRTKLMRSHHVSRATRKANGVSTLSATETDTPLPKDPIALQKRLWEAADVLPDMTDTQLRLAKTQETGVSDLGFLAARPISKGDVIISVPLRYALVVNMKSGSKGDEQPSDVRLALQLLRVLDLTDDAGEAGFDEDVKAFWRSYALRILPRETFAAIAWEEADIEELQYERTVEEVKALRSRLEELCQRALEEDEDVVAEAAMQEDDGKDDEDEEQADSVPVPRKRKVNIKPIQAVRLPGGNKNENMMEDATVRWALSIVRSRSFMLDKNADSPVLQRAIVPVADLFNHQPEGPLAWAAMEEELTNPWSVVRGDDGMLYVDICAHRNYKLGEEVLLPYGLETAADLLCSHGIVVHRLY
jgi:hypothetical protein